MTRRSLLTGLAALCAAGCAGASGTGGGTGATGPTTTTTSEDFRVEVTPGVDRKGRPTAWGYVYGRARGRPRLRMETLDASGKPIANQLVYVDEDLHAGRAYFEIRPNTPGPAYRATVESVISTFNGAP
jgi:hypothetical protein